MKLRRRHVSHPWGAATISGSTRSAAMVMPGMSERKLRRRIWRGSSGRNGRTIVAAAIENMLPKLAEMVTWTYLMVLAKTRLPCRIPSAMTPRSLLSSTMLAVWRGDADSGVDRDTDVGPPK